VKEIRRKTFSIMKITFGIGDFFSFILFDGWEIFVPLLSFLEIELLKKLRHDFGLKYFESYFGVDFNFLLNWESFLF
jgi:hypothetical protein